MDKQYADAIGIIGGGLGSLAAACTLAARGHRVVLFERNGWLGGKAAQLESNGFRFDMGPTIVTVPRVFERVFSEAGRPLDGALGMVRLDPQWRCFFDDGSRLDLREDTEAMAAALGAFSPRAGLAAGYRDFMKLSQRLASISDNYFFWKPVGSLRDMLDLGGLGEASTLGDVWSMRLWSTVADTVRDFLPDVRVRQMAEHFTQYVGSSPLLAPAILCGIAHMQTGEGIWYPMGGTRAIPEALAGLAGELGAHLHTDAPVRRIVIENGRAAGIELQSGDRLALAAVVSGADVVRTHRELIGAEATEPFRQRRRYEPACSGVVLYLGLNRRYDHLAHHNFVFSRDAAEEFQAIYHDGVPAPDPTCYLAAPSATEAAVAPDGGEALYVLVHTPYLRRGHHWETMLAEYRRVILDKLRRTGGMGDIDERIVFESALTPVDIRDRYSTLDGAIYGLASHGRLTGALKPSNRSPDFKGLYFAGGSAHPGAGMPMATMSGWIAADALDGDRRK